MGVMGRPPNPYRVLAHALDVGDLRLAEVLSFHLTEAGRTAAAQAAVERLMRLLRMRPRRG